MNVKTYCQAAAVILLLLGVLGLLGVGIPGFLSITEPTEVAIHFISGGLAAWADFIAGGYSSFAKTYAQVFGAIYLVLGVIGFVAPDLRSVFTSIWPATLLIWRWEPGAYTSDL